MGEELELEDDTQRPVENVICADCEDEILLEEEIVLLQIVHPHKVGGVVNFYPVMDEGGMELDFQFEPYHFCFECWEDVLEKIKEESADIPPILDALGVIECSCCGSSILEWETVGTWTVEEFLYSRRSPVLEGTWGFGPAPNVCSKPEVLCTYCVALANEYIITMWEDFPDPHTCADCVQLRCWRHKSCGCICHEGEKNE